MNYPNLPGSQRDSQRLVDQFNADEAHWRSLEPRRRLRRKILRRLKKEEHRALDLLEFSKLRPADDCIARIMPKAGSSGQGGVGGVQCLDGKSWGEIEIWVLRRSLERR